MQYDVQVWLMFGGAFIAVAMVTILAGDALLKRHRLRLRIVSHPLADEETGTAGGGVFRGWTTKFLSVNDGLVGLDDAGLRSKARYQMIRAGFFSPNAAKIFAVVQASLIVLVPLLGYLSITPFAGKMTTEQGFGLYLTLIALGYLLPDFYIKRCEKNMLEQYRLAFPDMLDLLIVCLDAGSGVNAALERVGRDIAIQSKALSFNMNLLNSEMRSGRSLVDALESFTKRVALDEAKSLAILIRQSVDLGTDVGEALSVYADEMRDKRMARAEAKAHELPVKMVLPLGVFIFPVIMIVIMTPIMIKLGAALGKMAAMHVGH